ncbi:MAG: hypothetical protein UW73_C0006G0019 [Microgenomates group bacterium GW2011_GWB1_44_8]|nr:MAG: hypothetical protein UW73_C0006G0019 [Microgenomates group bacterium GW2011_GWB1_44_8]
MIFDFNGFIRKTVRHNFLPENRVNTVIEVAAVVVWMLSALLFYLGMFRLFPQIGPWNKGNMVLIIASFFITDGLTYSLLERNLHHLAEQIEDRNLDTTLLRPGSFRKYVGFRRTQFSSMVQIPIALLMLTFLYHDWSWQVLLWIVSLVFGFFIIYHLWYCFDLLTLWFKLGRQVYPVLNELTGMGQFPYITFMSSKLVLLFFPFLAVAALPAHGMVTQNMILVLFYQSVLLALLYVISVGLERRGLEWYRR